MQYVLHVTNRCNFRCDYCTEPKNELDMDFSVARRIADAAVLGAMRNGQRSTCLSFYGGEPLLMKPFIYDTVDYCRREHGDAGVQMHYRMTTNGALLDGAFLSFAREHGFRLALSIDGVQAAHDLHRRDESGAPTFDRVLAAAVDALKVLPGIPAMMTVNPDTAPMLLKSVRFVYGLGFRMIVTTPNYQADWRESDLSALGAQYQALADWYGDALLSGKQLQLSLFDAKFINHLTPEIDRGRCTPGERRLSVAVDGAIYPCTQYAHHPEYRIGSAEHGIHGDKLQSVRALAEQEPRDCGACALSARCDNRCGCKNLATTGRPNQISPIVCAHERLLIPIADQLGERIFCP